MEKKKSKATKKKSLHPDAVFAQNALVSTLREMRKGGRYPAGLDEWRAKSGMQPMSSYEAKKIARGLRPHVLVREGDGPFTVAFAEDIELLVDLRAQLAVLKASGKWRDYPPSITAFTDSLRLPRGWKQFLKARLDEATRRPLAGVKVKEVRHQKRVIRKIALLEDRELLELLSLRIDDLRQRVVALWRELEELRSMRANGVTTPQKARTGTKVRKKVEDDTRDTPHSLTKTKGLVVSEDKLGTMLNIIEASCRKSDFKSVKVSELRTLLPEVSREEMDMLLIGLGRSRRVNLIPLNDASMLSPGEEDTLLKTGGTLYYSVSVRKGE